MKCVRIAGGKVPIVRHRDPTFVAHLKSRDATSIKKNPWLYKSLSPSEWNSMRYTQIVLNNQRGDDGPWTRNSIAEHMASASSNFVKGEPGSVLVFHGTTTDHLHNFAHEIYYNVGEGCLGYGFYVTFDPTEALGYACRRSGDPVVLEMIIPKAKEVSFQTDDDACRDDVCPAQVVLRRSGRIRVVRVHVFKRAEVGAFPTYHIRGFAQNSCSSNEDYNHPKYGTDDPRNFDASGIGLEASIAPLLRVYNIWNHCRKEGTRVKKKQKHRMQTRKGAKKNSAVGVVRVNKK